MATGKGKRASILGSGGMGGRGKRHSIRGSDSASSIRLDNAEVSIQRQDRARAENSRAACHHGDGQSVL